MFFFRTTLHHLSDQGSIPVSCGLSLLLVIALIREFFSGFPGFPPSTKSTSKFQFDLDVKQGNKLFRATLCKQSVDYYCKRQFQAQFIDAKFCLLILKAVTQCWSLLI